MQVGVSHIFKYTVVMSSDRTIACSVSITGIENNSVTRTSVIISMVMMGRRKHTAQEKYAITQPDVVIITMQQECAPRTTRQFYNNVDL